MSPGRISSIAADAGQPHSRLPCLTQEEQRQLHTKRIKLSSASLSRSDDLQELTNLTPLQFQFWVGQTLQPETALLNLTDTFTIAGPVDHAHFQRAFQDLVDHTDALRTVIEEVAGIPRQRVVDRLPYALECLDFSREAQPHAAFQAWLQRRAQSPFDLGKRLFESALVKVSENQFIWYLSVHHIVSDGWSFRLIFYRMQALYRAALAGRLNEPVAFPSYREFVDYERAYRRSPQYLADQAYWEHKLAHDVEPITFYGRAHARQAATVRRVAYELGAERTSQLKAVAMQARFAGKSLNVSLFNILAGVFAAYLHRISGNDYLSIGTPFLNRPSAAFRETVGLSMQVAPLRITVAEGDSFSSLVKKVQAESGETARHCPYTVRNYQNRLYDVIFNYHNVSFSTFHGMPVQENWLHSGNDGNSFSLHVRYPEAESLLLHFDFHPDVFDEGQQARAVEHLVNLLDAFLEDPGQPISRANLLSLEEKQCVLAAFNHTRAAFSEGLCVHELFEAQVERAPDSTALVYAAEDLRHADDRRLTYRELNTRANQLAHYLQKHGVGPEVLVGICMERSLEMMVALLGILKAGGAYLPLDPALPRELLAYMLQDSQAKVLITQERLLAEVPEHQARVLCMDADWDVVAREDKQNLASGVAAGNLAYVIYTSGSTGRPKGVQIEHRSLVNFLTSMRREPGITADDVLLAVTTLSFDIAGLELFLPLISGARVVITAREASSDGIRLQQILDSAGATAMQATPATWHLLLASSWPGNSRLKVLCGGEAMPRELANQLLERSATLWNLYGPTETTIWSTLYKLSPGQGSVPIGCPIANTQIYILDAHLQPVPVGVIGDLYIGGDGLARGYLNRPELTAEKFIPHPFCDEPGARLYRTGDLARYLPDGAIEFLGRTDHQVKMRGFRVELGEIETLLGQHPAVREAVVALRGDEPQKRRLVAYVVARGDARPKANDLRRFLSQKLPDPMIPSTYLLLDALPLTPSGKVDRRALPEPDEARPELESAFVAPRNPIERKLADIWSHVLKLDRVGIYDNFLELGGHSLLATQIVSRIREAFQVELSLHSLFETPTVADLAVTIAKHIADLSSNGQARLKARLEKDLDIPPDWTISRRAQGDSARLSFAQQRLWFLDQLEPGSAAYHISASCRLAGALQVSVLHQSLNEIVRRHATLRTTFSVRDGQPVQLIAPALNLALPVLDLRELPAAEREAEAKRLAGAEARRPFNLAEGPLLRATLLHLDEEEHLLLLTMHHIVSDGWSMGVLFQELSALYRAFSAGEPSPLPELPIQYADFGLWQRDWLQGKVLEAQLAYWKKQLEGAPSALDLPTDCPRPAHFGHQGASRSLPLPDGLTQDLKALSHREGATLFMTLLAAFQILLHRYSGRDDMVIGTPIANRHRPEIEGLIGFFVNSLVLRTSLAGNPSFRELLGRVREATLGAYAHQDLPFEKLVEELQPARDIARHPLFDVMLNFVNVPPRALELAGLTIEFQEKVIEPESKFALTLYVTEKKEALDLRLVYRVALFSDERMACLLSQLRHVLEQIVTAPDQPIASYSLVTPESRSRLPDPSLGLPEPPQTLVTDMVAGWAGRLPHQPAIRQGGRAWTYRQLAESAEITARALVAEGLKPGDVVAVCGQRSFGLIASALAAFLSGGVLLTLDRNLPIQRQRLMIREAHARYVLYVDDQPSGAGWLTELQSLRMIYVDPDQGQPILKEQDVSLPSVRLPQLALEDPAYIFFTSGTTGVPKGILGWHKGLSHFLSWQRETFGIGPGDRSAQLIGLSFDAVLRDLFLPLTSGATLCLPADTGDFGPGGIWRWLEGEQITMLHTVPTLTQSWLDQLPWGASLHSLRWVFFTGEPLTDTLVRRWRECLPDSGRVINFYGPTETTMVKCFYRVPEDMLPGVQPLGWPLPQSQALVLKENHQLCGIGESGEIVLRTPFRTLGYLNAPEENARRFIKNPYRDDDQDLLYFTGDLGRYRPDGALEILGRLDHQVKIRGVRVEPDEVTAVLLQHPAVRAGVVIAREDEAGQHYLVAYLVVAEPDEALKRALRAYLSGQLPAAMIPAAFVFLEQLPLTPNGKVDRRALPAPDRALSQPEDTFVAPRTPVEETLAGIWARVLGLERVGVHNTFFELGGHSLLATRVVSHIRQACRVELPLRSLFETPTIAGLAETIEQMMRNGAELSAPSILPVSREAYRRRLP